MTVVRISFPRTIILLMLVDSHGFVGILGALLVYEVAQALAALVHAPSAVLAVTAAAETSLSGLDAVAVDHGIDEAKVGGQDGLVDLVDNCNRDGFVVSEGS